MTGALAGLVMLIIGDSHIAAMDRFNNALHDGLLGQGAAVHSFGVCNSVPDDWITPVSIVCGRGERHNAEPARMSTQHSVQGWALPELIARYHPNIVVIELGDTMAGYGATAELPRARIADQVHELLAPIEAHRLACIWVGPPWGTEGGPYKKTAARVKELSDYLAQIVAPCRYIDSLEFSRPGQWTTRDGVHLTPESYQAWDGYLIKAIVQIVSAELHAGSRAERTRPPQ